MLPHSFSFSHLETASSPQTSFYSFSSFKTQYTKKPATNVQVSYSYQEVGSCKNGTKPSGTTTNDPDYGCRIGVDGGLPAANVFTATVVGFAPKVDDKVSTLESPKSNARVSLLSEQIEIGVGIGSREINSKQTLQLSGFSHTEIHKLSAEDRQLWYNTQLEYPVFCTALVKEAYAVAARAFHNQVRLNGQSVLSHAVETAKHLAELGCDENMVAVALLHDVLDDSEMTEAMLSEFVPRDVVDKVLQVSRLSALSQLHRDAGSYNNDQDAATASYLYIAMSNVEAVIVKLADRLHNMKTLDSLPSHKRLRIAKESLSVFVPIANRLGIWSIKSQLEDLCFKYLQPEEFLCLKQYQNQDISRGNIERCLEILQRKLAEKKVFVEDLYGRTKSLYSVFQKLQKKGKQDQSFEEACKAIYDVRAIRIIVRTKAECYAVARQVEQLWELLPGRYKDYIRKRKENGYQSLHLVVKGPDGFPLEVQIRTAKMHYLAEYGVAAHWRYKEQSPDSEVQDEEQAVIVRYKRWLTQKMRLYDMKCRPCNDTSCEHSFDSLGLDDDSVSVRPQSAPSSLSQGDAFTRYMKEHDLLPSSRVKIQQNNNTPITIVYKQGKLNSGLAYKSCPPHATAQWLLDMQSSSSQDKRQQQLFINNKKIVDFTQDLHNGDVVEFVCQQQSVEPCKPQVAVLLKQVQDSSSQSSGSSASSMATSEKNLDVQLLDLWVGGLKGDAEGIYGLQPC